MFRSIKMVLFIFIFAAQALFAESIIMKDGSVIEGDITVDFLNSAIVEVKLKDGSKKSLSGKDISRIMENGDFKIKRTFNKKDGTSIEGYVMHDGWFHYTLRKDLSSSEEFDISKSDIKSMEPHLKKTHMRPAIIAKKKEDWYFTGMPVIAYTTDNGFRGGARAYFFWNDGRDDKFFDSTPYKISTYIQATASTTGLVETHMNFDWMHIGGTFLRIKAIVEYEVNPNANYFGVGSRSTDLLKDVNGTYYKTFEQYKDFLYRNNYEFYKYNKYEYEIPKFSVDFIGEWNFPLKPLLGYEFKYAVIKPWDSRPYTINGNTVTAPASNTLLGIERPLGFNGGITSTVRAGVAFDTRDFEPDPHEGFFIDYAFEGSTYAFGSQYDYIRNTVGFRFYTTWFNTLTLALRLGYVASLYDIPFYEMGTFGFLFERQVGLGGEKTLRAYQQWRFIGKGMTLANLELRYRFIDFILLNQRISFKVLAFVDAGNAYTEAVDAFTKPRFSEYKLSYGFGGNFTWNQATVAHLYIGFSPEDINVSLNFSHSF